MTFSANKKKKRSCTKEKKVKMSGCYDSVKAPTTPTSPFNLASIRCKIRHKGRAILDDTEYPFIFPYINTPRFNLTQQTEHFTDLESEKIYFT